MQNKFDRVYVPGPVKWRQIKVRTSNGWIKCDRKLLTQEKVKEWLLWVDGNKGGVLDAYFSVSCFLNPHKVYGYKQRREGFPKLDRKMLRSDFVFDFDQKNMPEGVDAYDVACHVFALLQRGYEDVNFIRTGKGWHIVILDWYDNFCRKSVAVMDRYFYISAMKRRFANIFRGSGIPFDYPVAIDSFRCIRMWNAPYHDGTLCEWRKNEVIPKEKVDASSLSQASQLVMGIPSDGESQMMQHLRKPSVPNKDSVGSGFLGKDEDSAQKQDYSD